MELKFNILLESGLATYPPNLTHPNINVINGIRNFNADSQNFSKILVVFEYSLINSDFLLSVGLYKTLFDLEILFISDKKELREIMVKYGEVYSASYLDLNYEALRSIYLKDETTAENLLLNLRTHMQEEQYYDKPEIRVGFLEAKLKDLEDKYEKTKVLLEEVLVKRSYESEMNKVIEGRYKSLLDSVIHNDIILRQFEHILSKDVYEQVERGMFKDSPRILYIKEYQDLPYKHSLIQTLAESVRLILRKPVKVLMLYDSSASKTIHYLPSQYHLIYNKYKTSDLLTKDYIAKVGPYRDILNILLKNQINLDTLIIVDCKDHTGSVVDKVESNLVLARDKEKTVELGVPPGIIVTNNEEDPLNWLYYEEYSKLSQEDKFTFLSSRPLIKRFLETWG